jgi:hypothetical protein
MQGTSGLKVIGTKDLYKSLRIIGTPTKEINAANREAAQEVLVDAKRLTPIRSGKLVRTEKISATMKSVAVTAGNETSVPYANPIHWGWSRSVKTGKRKNIKPQPFLARALGYNRKEILANYYKQMEKLINSQMAKGPIK